MASQEMLGVLGGMGPLATADFFRKLIEETSARCDQEHIPVAICSLPDIPCRTNAILHAARSPLPRMLDGLRKLDQLGATCIVVPCNSAHYWHKELAAATSAPVLHIVDAVREQIRMCTTGPVHLGILGTESTIAANIYQNRLRNNRFSFTVNSPEERNTLVTAAITLVKAGEPSKAGALLEQAIYLLLERGVETPVLACTEIPVALAAINSPLLPRCIDATRALARAAVRWWLRRHKAPPPHQPAPHLLERRYA